MTRTRLRALAPALLLTALPSALSGQEPGHEPSDPYDSGGLLIRQQAAYDVTFYDLDLAVQPADSSIDGTLRMVTRVVAPTNEIAVDLDTLLAIESIGLSQLETAPDLRFERAGGRVFVRLPYTAQPGEELTIRVAYGGRPRVAPNPPWDGGFAWAETPGGKPWIATANQGEGADVWWPNKDHVSDKPDSMALHVRVPEPLVVASNGQLRRVEEHSDGTRTYHWFVSTPISNYNVALNIAPYRTIETEFESVAGETFPFVFYVLPSSYEQGIERFSEFLEHMRWFERAVGPYPFRIDKYGVAQTPHLGMEHQSIVAYGASFDNAAMTAGVDWGFDVLHHHELSHEWWGNLVTAADWKDAWLHEGFGTYMQALYLQDSQGIERYHEYMAGIRPRIPNEKPVAGRHSATTSEAWGHDIYFKGAWVLHTLRYLVGEEQVREMIRRLAYPSPEAARAVDGRQARFVSTRNVISLAEEVSGQDLEWFFEVYLRQTDLPRLVVKEETGPDGRTFLLSWDVPRGLAFPMPVDVRLGGEIRRVEVGARPTEVRGAPGADLEVDPENWVLRELR
jgi:aminopeptidase N